MANPKIKFSTHEEESWCHFPWLFYLVSPYFCYIQCTLLTQSQSRDFSGHTTGTPQTDFSISIRLNSAEKGEGPWTNSTSEAPLSPTDYERPLSKQLRWLLPTHQVFKAGELNATPVTCPDYRICVSTLRGVAQLHCSTFQQWLTCMAFVVWIIPDLFAVQPNKPFQFSSSYSSFGHKTGVSLKWLFVLCTALVIRAVLINSLEEKFKAEIFKAEYNIQSSKQETFPVVSTTKYHSFITD